MTSKKTYNGTCLCGTVEYTVSSQTVPEKMFFCHCSRCRKGTGSIHAANIFFNNAKLDWISGVDNQMIYKVPDSRHSRTFCKTCGSPLPNTWGDGNVILPAGTLDIADELVPTAHIQCKSRAKWEDSMLDIPRYEEYP